MSKHLISLRVDEETLTWFRHSFEKGYQTKMNQILKDYKKRREIKLQTILQRAQQLFVRFHARCFWHLNQDLMITPELLPLILEGLKKHGGKEGYQLASEITVEEFSAD